MHPTNLARQHRFFIRQTATDGLALSLQVSGQKRSPSRSADRDLHNRSNRSDSPSSFRLMQSAFATCYVHQEVHTHIIMIYLFSYMHAACAQIDDSSAQHISSICTYIQFDARPTRSRDRRRAIKKIGQHAVHRAGASLIHTCS